MKHAISSVNVDDTTNVWNHVHREIFDKIDVDASACIIIRAIEKYGGMEGRFWLRVPVDSIVGVNI